MATFEPKIAEKPWFLFSISISQNQLVFFLIWTKIITFFPTVVWQYFWSQAKLVSGVAVPVLSVASFSSGHYLIVCGHGKLFCGLCHFQTDRLFLHFTMNFATLPKARWQSNCCIAILSPKPSGYCNLSFISRSIDYLTFMTITF